MKCDITPCRDDIFYPFEQFFNKIFDETFSGFSGLKGNKHGFPRMDIITEKNKWIVEAAVPGVASENLSVEIVPDKEGGRLLKISGTTGSQYSADAGWSVKELRRSYFERSFFLPTEVEGEPEATLKDGLLRLVWALPEVKCPEKKTVPIKYLDGKQE